VRVLLLIGVVGCGGPAANDGPPRSPPGTGEAYTSIAPAPEVDALAADFRGSCAFARPPGEAIDYQARIGAHGRRDRQAIDVRANPHFDPEDRDNVIGELVAGKRVAAAGPIAPGGEKAGLGYAVLVRDSEGRVCRGYVSAAEVDVLSSP
jgi:hypothetical protein